MANKTFVKVECKDCHIQWSKRKDTLLIWEGRCRSCAQIFRTNQPEAKNRQRELSRKQVIRQGGITNAKKFTSDKMSGANHPNWKGGKQERKLAVYNSKAYKDWRITVFSRDNYTCQDCDKRGGILHAHHIIPVSIDFDKILDLENGQTLCASCHAVKHQMMRMQAQQNAQGATV